MMKYALPITAAILGLTEAYKSGEVRSHETFKYGKFVARIQTANKKGTCTSFFTYWTGTEFEPWSLAGWNEIDVEIVPTVSSTPYSTNIIYANQ